MKTIAAFTFTLFIVFSLTAQNLNTEINKEGQSPYLLGKINKNGLEGENYTNWFSKNYEEYTVNTSMVNKISPELASYDIKLFMGTWCGDSKKEVPKFYKVLETANFPMEQLTVVAVSREANMYKQSPQHEEAGLNIHRVPTAIFYKNGKEINRIVEHPVESFEKDIQKIISTNKYKSNYQIVTVIDNIIKSRGLKKFKNKQRKLLKNYKNKVSSMYELNTYAHILYGTDRKEEAIAVFNFNTKLFPKEPSTHMSLANTLGANGQKEKAIKILENALKIHPTNNDLKENLELIKSN